MRTLISTTAFVAALAWSQGVSAQAPATDCRDAQNVQFVCGLQAPEDLVAVPGDQWVIASAYSGTGGIYLLHTSDRKVTIAYPSASAADKMDAKTYPACPGPPDAAAKAKFQTHGLYLQPGRNRVHRLYAVTHSSRESVEVFDLDTRPQTPALTWIGCVVAPEPIGLNAVRALPDGGLVTTNFLARGGDAAGRTKMMAGEKNGELWEWHTATGLTKIPGSEAAGANGVEMSSDGRWFYIAAWGSQSFFRLSRGRTPPQRDEIPLGFRVDNIRWARDRSLLAVGQGGQPGMQTTIIVKIDPKTMKAREIARYPNTDAFGAGTVAVEIGDKLWVGSYLGNRVAIYSAK